MVVFYRAPAHREAGGYIYFDDGIANHFNRQRPEIVGFCRRLQSCADHSVSGAAWRCGARS